MDREGNASSLTNGAVSSLARRRVRHTGTDSLTQLLVAAGHPKAANNGGVFMTDDGDVFVIAFV